MHTDDALRSLEAANGGSDSHFPAPAPVSILISSARSNMHMSFATQSLNGITEADALVLVLRTRMRTSCPARAESSRPDADPDVGRFLKESRCPPRGPSPVE